MLASSGEGGRAPSKRVVFADVSLFVDFGVVLGALTAAGPAAEFSPSWRIPARSLIGAVIGGLLLGYGTRLTYGCNIGAHFSGIASGSLHAWLWLAAAFAGSLFGTKLPPLFGSLGQAKPIIAAGP